MEESKDVRACSSNGLNWISGHFSREELCTSGKVRSFAGKFPKQIAFSFGKAGILYFSRL
jgi:hypothetical protein